MRRADGGHGGRGHGERRSAAGAVRRVEAAQDLLLRVSAVGEAAHGEVDLRCGGGHPDESEDRPEGEESSKHRVSEKQGPVHGHD